VTLARLRLVGQVLAVGLVAALFALLVWRLVQAEDSGVRGDIERGARPSAPDFELARLDTDGDLRLSSLRGKVVVLNFWASWCEPCKEEAPVLERTWKRFGPQRLVVVGVDSNDLGSLGQRFARRYGMTYPLVHDGRETLTRPYGLTGLPETFVIDRRGRILGAIAGALNARDELNERYDELISEALRT
jgi:cytochrome c biogenesis protein CcmG/thiol:disulfide interchange protein DsbE